jgi:periplasmic protein CpxP/Spy
MTLTNLLRMFIVAAALLGTSSLPAAEPSESQREAIELKIQELRERLALTPDQEQKLAPLIEERNTKLRNLFSRLGADASRREKRAMLSEARSIQEDFNREIEPILSADQMREWEAFRKEARAEARERYRNRN